MKKLVPDTLRIACLPIAGLENPYQHLMMQGLRAVDHLDAVHGVGGKAFAALLTSLRTRADVIHYDWIHRYYLRRFRILTWLQAPIFIVEVMIVRYVMGCRIVWTMHNLVSHDGSSGSVELWVRRRFARLCDWIRVFDESTAERASGLLGIDRNAFRVQPEGSYEGYYPNSIGRLNARQRLGIKPDEFVLLYVGQVRPYKGIEDLLEAYRTVRSPRWRLLIAGLPLDRKYAQSIVDAAASVGGVDLFMQYIEDDELQIYFNASDVVVLPYLKVENSGSALLAMGFAKPVVAPRLGTIPRRLRRQDELLYEPGELTEALSRVQCMSSEYLAAFGEQNLKTVTSIAWSDFARLFEAYDKSSPLHSPSVATSDRGAAPCEPVELTRRSRITPVEQRESQ